MAAVGEGDGSAGEAAVVVQEEPERTRTETCGNALTAGFVVGVGSVGAAAKV